MKTVTDLELVNFSDCPICTTTINLSEKDVQVAFDYLYLNKNEQWEAIDQLTLTLSSWEELIVETFQDDAWILLEPGKYETFKEIHEVSRQRNQFIMEGFSAKSGYWLKYTFKGDMIYAAIAAQTVA